MASAVVDAYNRARYLPEMTGAIEKWEVKLSEVLAP
jgi:hypothetical protein